MRPSKRKRRSQWAQTLSEALAEAGAHVIIAARRRERCEAGAAELVKRGLRASGESYDQGDEASILAFAERVWNTFGAIDILVNNSVAREMFRYEDPIEKWRKSLEVNGAGLFALSRAFVDRMMARGKGSVINISSIQGVVAPDFGNYAGTSMTTPPDYQFHKHGLIGLTKYLAAWGGPRGVRCSFDRRRRGEVAQRSRRRERKTRRIARRRVASRTVRRGRHRGERRLGSA